MLAPLVLAIGALVAPRMDVSCAARAQPAAPRGSRIRMGATLRPEDVTIVMNGLPGAMGLEIASACVRRGMRLAPVALTGPNMPGSVDVELPDGSSQTIRLVAGPSDLSAPADAPCEAAGAELASLKQAATAQGGALVCIDFTHPTAVNPNGAWYARHGLPYVMGTTGGDRAALTSGVESCAGQYAVIAPNMAKGIVALQAGLARMAEDFPGAFEGYTLRVTESHQKTKADTSGTAKAISASLAALAADSAWGDDRIVRIRDEADAMAGAPTEAGGYGRLNPVPAEAINGHAYHTYSLVAPDGSVEFQFRHNVNGRAVYAEGTADAALYLAARMAEGSAKRLYTMVDILEGGGME